MITGVFIPCDESLPIEKREYNGLADYQAAVGGNIEAIDLEPIGSSFFANDESKLIGLEVNRRATLMWWLNTPSMRHRDVIGGDVALVGMPDDEGETVSVPTEVLALLFETTSYRTMFQTAGDPVAFNGNGLRYENYFEAVNAALVKFDQWAAVERCKVVPA